MATDVSTKLWSGWLAKPMTITYALVKIRAGRALKYYRATIFSCASFSFARQRVDDGGDGSAGRGEDHHL